MTRSVEAMDGLALLGPARIGPLGLRLPTVAFADLGPEATVPSEGTLRLGATDRTEVPGSRGVILSNATDRLELLFPIPTPEVSGYPGVAREISPGAWYVHWPPTAEDLERLRAAQPAFVIWANARVLLGDGLPFVEALRDLRATVGGGAVVWAPRIALPHRLALLAYLGIDVLDSTESDLQAVSGRFFDLTLGSLDEKVARSESTCGCPACRPPLTAGRSEHTQALLRQELALVRAAIRNGRLRELVEARLGTEPALAELLRYADRFLASALEERVPVVSDDVRTYILSESHRRPEVQRYRRLLSERYHPPRSREVLLLLPCSRTKPYRNSRSHRRMWGALEGIENLHRVHKVSVTSPLGAVPAELEDTYPARNYDIPVTGEWDDTERRAVLEAVASLLRHGNYREVVIHLDPVEYGFLGAAFPVGRPLRWTLADRRTATPEALRSLREAVELAIGRLDRTSVRAMSVVREDLHEVAAFQFGREAADRLFAEPVRLAGRPWFQRLTDGKGTDLATWQDTRGLFQLTVAGGERIAPARPMEVEVDPNVGLMGDLFCPGVSRADPAIRVGDAVLLVRGGELLGVGEAMLPGSLMNAFSRGTAVRVRHRRHGGPGSAPATDIEKTEDRSQSSGPVV